jgi:hypothetical protein
MSRHIQDELKHWKKESYRTLEDAEQATGQPWASTGWKDATDIVDKELAATCFLAFTMFAIGLYILGA